MALTERHAVIAPAWSICSSGQISREIFVNDEIYAEEQERIFARAWLLSGTRARSPTPATTSSRRMGEESVILCRDRAGAIHVFLNSCRHRGMKVCRYDEGNTAVFTCPYHGWSYGTDGRLVGVPYFREAYHSELDQREMGPRRGRAAVQLQGHDLGHLGPGGAAVPRISRRLHALSRSAARRLGRARGPGRGAGRHAEMADAVQLEIPGREFQRRHLPQYQPPLGRSGRHRAQRAAAGATCGERNVEPQAARLHPRPRPPDDPLRAAARTSRRRPPIRTRRSSPSISAIARRSGAGGAANSAAHRRARRDLPEHGAAAAAAAHDGGVASARPAPDRGAGAGSSSTATRRSEVKDFLRDYYIRYSGPAGMTEQDDMENWNYAHAASRGTIARRYPYNYEMGMRHAVDELRVAGAARCPAGSSTSPRRSRARSRCATSTGAGPSSWRPRAGTSC